MTKTAPARNGKDHANGLKKYKKTVIWDIKVRRDEVISGVNGVAVDRRGLILWVNGAAGSRKVSRYLPTPRDALKTSKTA